MKIEELKKIVGEMPEEKVNEIFEKIKSTLDSKDMTVKDLNKQLKEFESQKKLVEDEKSKLLSEKETLNKKYTIVFELGIKDEDIQNTLMSLAEKQQTEGKTYADVIKGVNEKLKTFYTPVQNQTQKQETSEKQMPAVEEQVVQEPQKPLAKDIQHSKQTTSNDEDMSYASFIRKKR